MNGLRIKALAIAACAVPAAFGAVGAASSAAAPGLSLKSISPNSAPEFTSVPVKVTGTGFSTEAGATTISFGETPATDVVCTSSRKCTAMTPEIADGPVEVTVTVGETTSNPVEFLSEVYRPPIVSIEPDLGVYVFSLRKLTDDYPAIFTPGNVYLQIKNATLISQTFTGPTGAVTLEPEEVQAYNIPVNEASPFVFELEGSAKPAKRTLTVKTKNPK